MVSYGVFVAYHLALDTSFLADERAPLIELPLKSPKTVALLDKPSSIERSISIIHGFIVLSTGNPFDPELPKSNEGLISDRAPSTNSDPIWVSPNL